MTTWTNVAVYGTDEQAVLSELAESLYSDTLVVESPPTLQMRLPNKADKEQVARELLYEFSLVETVVMVQNSDTGDWATAYIFSVPDDIREIECEEIVGASGMDGKDVEQKLINRGFPVDIQHFTTTIEV